MKERESPSASGADRTSAIHGCQQRDVAGWWQSRELGFNPGLANAAFSRAAEDSFVTKETLHERLCEVPGIPRSTFLIVFSPDGTKVASTHGNHDVYISELSSGKHLKTLSGHPRTPWCVAFHPSHTQVLASGCLGGQVRVWDLTGGSEVWELKGNSVASIAFHPRDHLLVIAASNELHFWDWSRPQPFKCVKTNNILSKIRFVAFDSLGHKLITGISCWSQNSTSSNSVLELLPYLPSDVSNTSNTTTTTNSATNSTVGLSRDQTTPSYHSLIQRYDILVRNYHRILMRRSQLSNTTDRGTDPMETDWNPSVDSSQSSTSNPTQRTATTNSFTQTNASDSRLMRTINSVFANRILNLFYRHNFGSSLPHGSSAQSSSSNDMNIRAADLQQPENLSNLNQNTEEDNHNILQEVTGGIPSVSSHRQYSNSTRSVKTTYLNRLENILEVFIDETLHSWDRCDSNCFIPSPSSTQRSSFHRDFVDNLTSPIENEPNDVLPNSSQSQVSSNASHRRSIYQNNRNIRSLNSIESNRNIGGDISSENRNLTDIHSMLRNSGDILINSIRTLRNFNNRLRIYRNRIRGNSSESRVEGQRMSSNDNLDRGRVNTYINAQRNNRNPVYSEQSNMSAESRNPGIFDRSSESRRLSVIHNRLRNSGDIIINSLTTLRNFKERLRVLQNDQTDEAVSETNNSVNVSSNIEYTDNNHQRPENSSTLFRRDENSSNESDVNMAQTNSDSISSNTIQNLNNLPSCSNIESTSRNSTSEVLDNDMNIPSTSGYRPNNINRRGPTRPHPLSINNDVFDRVVRGVNLIVTHNQNLLDLWSRVLSTHSDPPLSEVRSVWDRLRTDIMQLHSFAAQRQPPSHFSSSRSRFINNTGNVNHVQNRTADLNNVLTGNRRLSSNNLKTKPNTTYARMYCSSKRIGKRVAKSATCALLNQSTTKNNSNNSNLIHSNHQTSNGNDNSIPGTSSSFTNFVDTQSNNMINNQEQPSLLLRRPNRSFRRTLLPQIVRLQDVRRRRNTAHRRTELEITRDIIRTHARKIVNTMFSIMMHCLDSNQLHNQLVTLVKSLKKALTLTCLLLMVNLFSSESRQNLSIDNDVTVNNEPSYQSSSSSLDRSSINLNIPNTNLPNSPRHYGDITTNRYFSSNYHLRRNDANIQVRRIRTHPAFCVRRRICLPSRNVQQSSDSNRFHRTSPNFSNRPSTSRHQEANISENNESSNNTNFTQASSSINSRIQSSRTRMMQNLRPNLFRSHVSRPCFFRRLLCSQGFLNDTLQQTDANVRLGQNFRESSGLRTLLSRLQYNSRHTREGNNDEQSYNAAHNVSVPVVHVNDVPIDMQNGDNPLHQVFVHRPDNSQLQNMLSLEDIIYDNRWTATIRLASEPTQTFRIQAWDFTNGELPNISDINKNVVVRECKIHNDANIDISRDGRLLVALLLTHRIGSGLNVLGIFSLEWHNLGECLYTTYMEQNAVSVSLSPCARHLAVGLGSKRVSLLPYGQNGIMAIIFRLDQSLTRENVQCPKPLQPIRRLEHNFQDSGFTSMNCLKWAPQPGQGLVYANSIGQLKILS